MNDSPKIPRQRSSPRRHQENGRGIRGHSGSNARRGGTSERSITADAEKEAKLLPIEWRCQTPPEQHQEVLDAVARSRRALDSADRVAKTIQLNKQGSTDNDRKGVYQPDDGLQFSPKGRSKSNSFGGQSPHDASSGKPPLAVQRSNSGASYRSQGSPNALPVLIGDYNDALGTSQTYGRSSFSAPVRAEKETVNFWGSQQSVSNGNGNSQLHLVSGGNSKQPLQSFGPQGYFAGNMQTATSNGNTQPAATTSAYSSAQMSFYPLPQGSKGSFSFPNQGDVSFRQPSQYVVSSPVPSVSTWGQHSIPGAHQQSHMWQQNQDWQNQRQQGMSWKQLQNPQPWQNSTTNTTPPLQPYPSPQPYSAPQSYTAPVAFQNVQHQGFIPPNNTKATKKTKAQSPNVQRRQENNMRNAGKSIVFPNDTKTSPQGSVRKQNTTPKASLQGATIISPAQLRAKSLNNKSQLKSRKSITKQQHSGKPSGRS